MGVARRAFFTGVTAALICGLAGCGGSHEAGNSGASTTTGGGPVVDVVIANGQVTPTNATLQAKVNQQITLKVSSDATDELHVHSTPDHKFQIAAAPNQTFQFSVEVPGTVEVELHHLKRTVATIQVRP
ncbi:hypothetical protein A5791_10935 [Mycobacterium sp. 852002-51163_SCH5372311]|uniref:hypothetical protein n=1 Tax=Mycobacterium sp. 852002-51163_SCH5372311 TaxID=1834097 RepID=UPI0007FCDDB8|nr:hypothetical protein [Mycobacterium sp. 852002-51163_SCH5372311]OBF79694.1 hypothetical protein A5791_10935 [Mycobacterium sp. 852002-51163_SCH5372311]